MVGYNDKVYYTLKKNNLCLNFEDDVVKKDNFKPRT